MPTLYAIGPYRFYVYSHDLLNEPPHVHVERDREEAKFWLAPVRTAYNHGFPRHELRKLQRLVAEYEDTLLAAWNDAAP